MKRTELEKYISETYGVSADYPWVKYPEYAVFRHGHNKKWFAVVMKLPKTRLGLEGNGTIDVMNVKSDYPLITSLLSETGFFPAYHMNKTNWISVALDGSAPEDKIKWILEISYELTE